jgi:MoxR-like ATPase
MNLNEYKSALLNVLFPARVTPLVWGYHGLGKSSVPQQIADAGGHRLVNFRLGNVEAGELLGLPSEVVAGVEKVATRNLMPEWLRDLITFCQQNPDKLGILHLDEINHIRRDMQSFVFQMALDHRLHETLFPENLHVICSANPPTDDYSGVFDFSNKALLSRFCHIKLQPTADEWIAYARAQDFDKDLITYIQNNPDQLDPVLQPFSIDEYANRNRRSYEFFSRFRKLGASLELQSGLIGSANVAAFYTWQEEEKSKAISGDDIFNQYSKVQDRVKKFRAEGKLGALGATIDSLVSVVGKVPEAGLLTMTPQVRNVASFICDLPPDLGWSAAYKICFLAGGHYGPEVAGAPTKDPGSVWGPHTCPELFATLTEWKTLGLAAPDLTKKEETPNEAPDTTVAKKKRKKA